MKTITDPNVQNVAPAAKQDGRNDSVKARVKWAANAVAAVLTLSIGDGKEVKLPVTAKILPANKPDSGYVSFGGYAGFYGDDQTPLTIEDFTLPEKARKSRSGEDARFGKVVTAEQIGSITEQLGNDGYERDAERSKVGEMRFVHSKSGKQVIIKVEEMGNDLIPVSYRITHGRTIQVPTNGQAKGNGNGNKPKAASKAKAGSRK